MPSILIVESEPDFQLAIERGINQYFTPQIYKAATAERALAYIRTFILDLIVSNASLGSGNAFDILKFLTDSHSSTPLILYSQDRNVDVIGIEYPNFLGVVCEEDIDRLIELVRRFQGSELFRLKQGLARIESESSRNLKSTIGGLGVESSNPSKSRLI